MKTFFFQKGGSSTSETNHPQFLCRPAVASSRNTDFYRPPASEASLFPKTKRESKKKAAHRVTVSVNHAQLLSCQPEHDKPKYVDEGSQVLHQSTAPYPRRINAAMAPAHTQAPAGLSASAQQRNCTACACMSRTAHSSPGRGTGPRDTLEPLVSKPYLIPATAWNSMGRVRPKQPWHYSSVACFFLTSIASSAVPIHHRASVCEICSQ
jgi:hypothetical protein